MELWRIAEGGLRDECSDTRAARQGRAASRPDTRERGILPDGQNQGGDAAPPYRDLGELQIREFSSTSCPSCESCHIFFVGPVLGRHWPATPAPWVTKSEVRFPNFPISAFSFCLIKPTVVGRFHGQAVLQRRVLAGTPAVLSLHIYQGKDKRKNWLPFPEGTYCEFVFAVAVKAVPEFVQTAKLGVA